MSPGYGRLTVDVLLGAGWVRVRLAHVALVGRAEFHEHVGVFEGAAGVGHREGGVHFAVVGPSRRAPVRVHLTGPSPSPAASPASVCCGIPGRRRCSPWKRSPPPG